MKLGVFLANTKARRANLTTDQLQQLAALGLNRAKTTQTQTGTA
ncbi:helicase [Streptomyces sp. NRRL S-31]|nr:helicase [Streptomyces sp. NRRL S-31]